jgi:hypothetical protein
MIEERNLGVDQCVGKEWRTQLSANELGGCPMKKLLV